MSRILFLHFDRGAEYFEEKADLCGNRNRQLD